MQLENYVWQAKGERSTTTNLQRVKSAALWEVIVNFKHMIKLKLFIYNFLFFLNKNKRNLQCTSHPHMKPNKLTWGIGIWLRIFFFFVIDDQNTNNSNNLFMNLLNLDALQKQKDYYNSPIINIFHNIMITTERTRLSCMSAIHWH